MLGQLSLSCGRVGSNMKCLECNEEAVSDKKLCATCQEWVDEPMLPNDRLYQSGLEISQKIKDDEQGGQN